MAAKPHPSASLYVGDLVPEITESKLYEIFNQIGPVSNIKVCRDAITRRSLGYAYVNFNSVVDAERALDNLNNYPIRGKPCRIMWSQRDPSIRKSGVGNIFIKNLDSSVGHKELHDTFSVFGNILSCKVATDENGNSRGYGFVHFESNDAAEKAISKVHGMMIGNMKVFVGRFIPKKEWQKLKENSWTNVFIKNLPPTFTEKDLEELFKPFGEVTSIAVQAEPKPAPTKKETETADSKKTETATKDDDSAAEPKEKDSSATSETDAKPAVRTLYGFVNYKNHDDAVKAVEAMHNKVIDGREIYCARAQKKAERVQELKKKFEQQKLERMTKYQGVNLYIKNLEDEITEDRLKKEFSVFGKIKSIKIMDDGKGTSKGFGFVCFTAPEEAQRAMSEMNGRILNGCLKPLYVNMHEPKEMRRQKLQAQYAARIKSRPQMPPLGQQMPGVGPIPYGPNGPIFYQGPQGFVPYGPGQMVPPRGGARWGPPQPGAQPGAQQGAAPFPNQPVPGNVQNYVMQPNMQRGGHAHGAQQRGGRQATAGQQNGQQGQNRRMQPRGRENQPAQPNGTAPPQQQPVPAQLTPEQQKMLIGEQLYQKIAKKEATLAGKITGMMLEGGFVEDLYHLLENEEALSQKVDEAVKMLKEAQKPEETPAEAKEELATA